MGIAFDEVDVPASARGGGRAAGPTDYDDMIKGLELNGRARSFTLPTAEEEKVREATATLRAVGRRMHPDASLRIKSSSAGTEKRPATSFAVWLVDKISRPRKAQDEQVEGQTTTDEVERVAPNGAEEGAETATAA